MVQKGCSKLCINKFKSLEQCRQGREDSCELCCSDDNCNTHPKEDPVQDAEFDSLTFLDPSPPQCLDQQPIQISCVEVIHVVRSANGFIEPIPVSWPTITDNSPDFRLSVNLPGLGQEPYTFDGTEKEIRWQVTDKHNARAICTTRIVYQGRVFITITSKQGLNKLSK